MNKNLKLLSVACLVATAVLVASCKKEPPCLPSNPDLVDPINQGRADGNAFVASETAAGTAAGQNLTYEQGLSDGRAILYNEVYSEAYTNAYNAQYIVGTAAGNQDSQSIANGSAAGTNAGTTDGCNAAKTAGYKQGCNEGRNLGYYTVTNGGLTCPVVTEVWGMSGKKYKDVTQADRDRCYKEAYDAIVGSNPNSWRQNAFNDAKEANVQYGNGVTFGRDRTKPENAQTVTDATNAGTNAGGPKGYNDGVAHGKQQAYNTAYTSAYNAAYANNLSNTSCINQGYGEPPALTPMVVDSGVTLNYPTGGIQGTGRYDGYIIGAKQACGIPTNVCPN